MKNENNQCFDINERNDELTKLKLLNITLIKELRKYKEENEVLRKYKEENAKLQKEKEILYGKIEKLEKEKQTLKSDFSSMENQNPHEETMDIVENILHSNIEIKEEPLDYYDLTKIYSNSESRDKTCSTVEKIDMEVTKFKSEICEKEISGKYKFELHMENINEGLKNYKCDKSIFEGETLKKHIHTVHEKHKDYKCESCSKSFSIAGNLKKHIARVHEGYKD